MLTALLELVDRIANVAFRLFFFVITTVVIWMVLFDAFFSSEERKWTKVTEHIRQKPEHHFKQ